MVYWATVFFVVALIAAIFGYSGTASALAGVAKFIFFLFVVLFALTVLREVFGRGRKKERGMKTPR